MSDTLHGLHPGIPAQRYHRGMQPQGEPRPLSSTLAKNLLRRLPAETQWLLEHEEHKDTYDTGTALHELLLEGKLKTVVELDYDSYRTKAAQEAKADAQLDGLTPILACKLADIREMAETVRSRQDVAALLGTDGMTEVSALTEIEGVPVQTRYDYLRLPADGTPGYIIDLKTVAESANPRDFCRNAAVYGYHIQAALYQAALAQLGHGTLPYYWLVVSKTRPWAHSIIQASQTDLDTGGGMAYKAIEMWRDITTNGWPTTTPIHQSALPSWAAYELEEL